MASGTVEGWRISFTASVRRAIFYPDRNLVVMLHVAVSLHRTHRDYIYQTLLYSDDKRDRLLCVAVSLLLLVLEAGLLLFAEVVCTHLTTKPPLLWILLRRSIG
jgi:hypothetical protein